MNCAEPVKAGDYVVESPRKPVPYFAGSSGKNAKPITIKDTKVHEGSQSVNSFVNVRALRGSRFFFWHQIEWHALLRFAARRERL
jgi:hypothetical protein